MTASKPLSPPTFLIALLLVTAGAPQDSQIEASKSGAMPVIEWSTVDGGGGYASAAGWSVEGSIGQADADAQQPSAGGDFTLTGGYWPGLIREPDALFADGFEAD